MKDIVIVSGKRTPMAEYGGALRDLSALELGAIAARAALEKAKLKLSDIDLIEINEAFAAQYLAVEKLLELERNKVNVNGGAIALGHPLGATGTRLVMTVLYELRRRNKRYGLAAACIGGGAGNSVAFEGHLWLSKKVGVLGVG